MQQVNIWRLLVRNWRPAWRESSAKIGRLREQPPSLSVLEQLPWQPTHTHTPQLQVSIAWLGKVIRGVWTVSGPVTSPQSCASPSTSRSIKARAVRSPRFRTCIPPHSDPARPQPPLSPTSLLRLLWGGGIRPGDILMPPSAHLMENLPQSVPLSVSPAILHISDSASHN